MPSISVLSINLNTLIALMDKFIKAPICFGEQFGQIIPPAGALYRWSCLVNSFPHSTHSLNSGARPEINSKFN